MDELGELKDDIECLKTEIRQKCAHHDDLATWIGDMNRRLDGAKRKFSDMEDKIVELKNARVCFKSLTREIVNGQVVNADYLLGEELCYFSDTSLELECEDDDDDDDSDFDGDGGEYFSDGGGEDTECDEVENEEGKQ